MKNKKPMKKAMGGSGDNKEKMKLKGYMSGGPVEIPMPGPSGSSTMRGMGAATKGGRFSGVK
jgi:hypothetical protein